MFWEAARQGSTIFPSPDDKTLKVIMKFRRAPHDINLLGDPKPPARINCIQPIETKTLVQLQLHSGSTDQSQQYSDIVTYSRPS